MKNKLSVITILFHTLADAGKEIFVYRKNNKKHRYLPANRIEILIQLQKIKQKFLT